MGETPPEGVPCDDLPPGWRRLSKKRASDVTGRHVDHAWLSPDGDSLLHLAARGGIDDAALLRALVNAAPASLRARGRFGNTPVGRALFRGREHTVRAGTGGTWARTSRNRAHGTRRRGRSPSFGDRATKAA